MKKSRLVLSIFVLSVLAITFAAAALPAPAQLPGYISENFRLSSIAEFLKDLVMGTGETGEAMSRLLLVLLLTAVLFRPTYKLVQEKSGLAFLVSFLVSVIGIRFFSAEMIHGLMMPYGIVAITISAILPMILIGILLETGTQGLTGGNIIRKIGWAFLAGAYFFLWDARWNEIGDMAYIYMGMAIFALLLLFFDGTIQRAYYRASLSKESARVAFDGVIRNKQELFKKIEQLNTPGLSDVDRRRLQREIRTLENRINELQKRAI